MNPILTSGQGQQTELDDEFPGGRAPLPLEQLEEHARHLAAGHSVTGRGGPRKELLERLDKNAARLEQIYKELSEAGFAERAETPSEEWLRDNHYVVRAQLLEIRRNLPRKYYEELPTLTTGKWKGYPRVYLFARDFVTHTAGRFDQESLRRFAEAYQEVTPLTIGELWAIPMMLRLALIESLRRLAEQILRAKRDREEARKFSADLLKGTAKPRTPLQLAAKASGTFIVEILHTLRDQSVGSTAAWRWLQTRLSAQGQSADELLRIEQHREAIDQLSIANIIGTMRALSALDWPLFVEGVSRVERILRKDPVGAYSDMDRATRDRYRKCVELLAKRSRTDELTVAERTVQLAQAASRETPKADRSHHVGYYLISRGRFELEPSIGYRPTLAERFARLAFRHPALGYLGVVAATTALFAASLMAYANNSGARWPTVIIVLLLTLVPISELAVSFINSILTTIIRPRPLPKLQLRDGLTEDLRTVVAVPSILSSPLRVRELVDALEVRALANEEKNLSFAILSDFTDAEAEMLPSDEELVTLARELIEGLNARYGSERFFLFHRKRQWNPSEQRWMGWERKRGKLHEFNRLLRGATDTSFTVQVGNLSQLTSTRYVITLDSDTDLPLDMGRRLVGTLAHPLNRARFDPSTRRVTEGYGILQPRVAIGAVSASATTFSRVFSGHVGLDPYTTAVSDVYQDLFHEGSYVGKGIYDVDAFERAMELRVPDNALLSHDLFEGLFARVALCTDLELIDDFPNHYLTWAARMHRWARGDWQLLPWLGRHVPIAGTKVRNTLPAIARWKIADNLRRSLLPLALVLLLLAGWLFLPGGPGIWTGTAFLVLFFPAYVQWGQTFTNRVRGVPIRDHIRAERDNLLSSFQQVLLTSAFLAHQSYVMVDAIMRTLFRLGVRRRLLEWEAAADTAAKLKSERPEVFFRMWIAPVMAVAFLLLVLMIRPSSAPWAIPVLLLWGTSPLMAYETGLRRAERGAAVEQNEQQELRRTARLTWRFFEETVGPGDNWLVPDNHQEGRADPIAHRTSPTNVGLQLLASITAWDLGYISSSDCLTSLERTLESMGRLARYRGHLFNWYDTQTLLPLAPLYVSTVDSGNLLGYLLTLKTALPELVKDVPRIDERFQLGLADTIALFERDAVPVVAARGRESSRDFRGDLRRLRSRLNDPAPQKGEEDAWLRSVSDDIAVIAARLHDVREKSATDPRATAAEWWLDRAASMVTARRRERALFAKSPEAALATQRERVATLLAFCEEFVDGTEMEFLFDLQRHLFAIGYNVTEGRRDPTYYDALASEARLASFVAIATRHVSQEHWFKLGRLMTPVGQKRALVSWSASMFEYLMPLLIMRTYERTLLDETYDAVIERQIEYAKSRSVPWGISESAYNVQDANGNYQYRAFGVPGLGLKRGLADDLVIAPYASILAAPLRPREVVRNLEHLASEGALGPMGYYESIDYTPERLEPGQRLAIVKTVMAHHHAMSLMALSNSLNQDAMQARFHAEPRVQAAELLLQERSPRLVPVDTPPEEHRAQENRGRVLESTVRRYITPHTVSPRAQLLSNGSYSVMVTNAGGGYSRWRDLAVTRWREDLTTDEWGTFCFIRDLESGDYWSAGFHPSGKDADAYEVTFAPDRAVLRRRDLDIETFTEVTVSPEDDAEIRRVSVTNHSRSIREIELTSYAEVVLTQPGADLAHPAFSNLFIQSTVIPEFDAILCARRPRAHEPRLYLGHVLAGGRRIGSPIEFETNRELFVGRGGTIRRPAAMQTSMPLTGASGAVLDPIVSLRVRLKVPPAVTVRMSFATVVAENEDGARALIEKYHDPQVSSRAFALASTHSEIELRHLGVSRPQEAQYQRLAARLIYGDPRLRSAESIARNTGTPADLWKYGISGDLPIVLATIADGGEVGLAQELVRAQEYLRLKNFKLDLVILNEIPTSYRQDAQDELQRIAESGASQAWIDRPGGVYVRKAEALSESDRILFRAVARAVLDGSRGGLEVQLRRPLLPPVPPPPLDVPERDERQVKPAPIQLASAGAPPLAFFNGTGGFTPDGRAYQIENQPPAPWSNVIANQRFGFVATDSTLGNTWSVNSYQNRLTPWRNDPVVDPPVEVVYVRDDETGEFWSATPAPAGPDVQRSTSFGQGFATYEHVHRGLEVELTTFVPVGDPVKVLRLRIRNITTGVRKLSAFYFADLCMSDHRVRSWPHIVTHIDAVSGALFARNVFRADFGSRVVFVDTSAPQRTLTGDRSGFIGRNGTLSDPSALRYAHLSGRTGARLDPCGAVHGKLTIPAKGNVEIIFTLGDGEDETEARTLVSKYRRGDVVEAELRQVGQFWNTGLSHVEVQTPDLALNILANRWLEYQTLSCRYFARSAFYQSGGAYGFRDQLQDVLALLHFDTKIAREHILRAASRQFLEGDVQHWWHEPGGEGVRTRIQDDRLWLVYAALEYADTTGDNTIFDALAGFIEQRAPNPDEHAVYERPTRLPIATNLYDHCTRAVARSLETGAHGLPLMGTGDWNDGMDEVGAQGHGESVWLGWFFASLLPRLATVAEARGDSQQAATYRAHSMRLIEAVERAWDGDWYRRAYFDNGMPLGSRSNTECQIDSLPQSWAVITGLGDSEHARRAMESVDEWLVDRSAELILLLTPAFDKAGPNPGYIRGYVPGVRENGGQYTHAALWVIMAYAMLGNGDKAHELLTFINPIHRTGDEWALRTYRVEPYSIAADIYSAPEHRGRGGWTWYTGAAGWMHRVILEHILGIRRRGASLTIDPCIPRAWGQFSAVLRVEGAEYRIDVENPGGVSRGVKSIDVDQQPLAGGRIPILAGSGYHRVRVVLGS